MTITNKISPFFDSILLVTFTVMSGLGCSDVKLSQKSNYFSFIASKSEFCIPPRENKPTKSRIIFVVDKSGSNSWEDPDNTKRAGNIQKFFGEYNHREDVEWAMIVFGNGEHKAQAYINDGSVLNPLFGDRDDMQRAIGKLITEEDGSNYTPYLSALDMTKRLIYANRSDNDEYLYNIFFLSDGRPNEDGETAAVTNLASDYYLQAVKELRATIPGKIFLNTVYYHDPNTEDEHPPISKAGLGLSYMAEAGGGKYVDLTGKSRLDFEEIFPTNELAANIMKRFHIVNLNSAFCVDGYVDTDSDADGLCDRDELLFNSDYKDRMEQKVMANRLNNIKFDPQNRNSLHSKYSDFFSFRFEVLPTGIGLERCSDLKYDEDFDFLNSCEEKMLFDTQPNGPTSVWTENLLLLAGGSALTKNPDSDGDGYLDFIEFLSFGVRSAAVNNQSIEDLYAGGISAEDILKGHRHKSRPDETAPSDVQFNVRFSKINTAGENCHTVVVDRLPLYPTLAFESNSTGSLKSLNHSQEENVILIYYIATPEENPHAEGTMYYSHQKVSYSSQYKVNLRFNNFEAYDIPEMKLNGSSQVK